MQVISAISLRDFRGFALSKSSTFLPDLCKSDEGNKHDLVCCGVMDPNPTPLVREAHWSILDDQTPAGLRPQGYDFDNEACNAISCSPKPCIMHVRTISFPGRWDVLTLVSKLYSTKSSQCLSLRTSEAILHVLSRHCASIGKFEFIVR